MVVVSAFPIEKASRTLERLDVLDILSRLDCAPVFSLVIANRIVAYVGDLLTEWYPELGHVFPARAKGVDDMIDDVYALTGMTVLDSPSDDARAAGKNSLFVT